ALGNAPGTTTIEMKAGSQFRVSGRGGLEVPSVTLDTIVAPYETVDLLKIDTEGAEYQALPSATADTLSRIRRIEMEYHPSGDPRALLRLLADRGFSVDAVQDHGGGQGTARLSLTRPLPTAVV